MEKKEDRSCWGCMYHQAGGLKFLGYCKYFETRSEEKKEVPPHVIDNGCRQFTKKSKLVSDVVKKFDGTFV